MLFYYYSNRYICSRVLKPELIAYRPRKFNGQELLICDFDMLDVTEQQQLLDRESSLSEAQRSTNAAMELDRRLTEGSILPSGVEVAELSRIYMVKKTKMEINSHMSVLKPQMKRSL